MLDVLCLQAAFLLGFWMIHGVSNPYMDPAARYQPAVLLVCQLAVIPFLLFCNLFTDC